MKFKKEDTKKGTDLHRFLPILAWQLPILAGSFPPTTFGVEKLNFCVRHGNRCILLAIATTLFSLVPSKLDIKIMN